MREKALFMSGNYKDNLQKIADVQAEDPEQVLFIQPHGNRRIAYLRNNPPSVDDPVTMYCSTSKEKNVVHFTGEVVGWDDKTTISPQKRAEIDGIITTKQAPEPGVYDVGVNLIHVRRLVRVDPPFSVEKLVKVSDDKPLATNNFRSGFSYVHRL